MIVFRDALKRALFSLAGWFQGFSAVHLRIQNSAAASAERRLRVVLCPEDVRYVEAFAIDGIPFRLQRAVWRSGHVFPPALAYLSVLKRQRNVTRAGDAENGPRATRDLRP